MKLPRDGSNDSELSVKSIPKEELVIGDYSLQAEGFPRERWEELVAARDKEDLPVDDEVIAEEHDNCEAVEFVEQGAGPANVGAAEGASAGIHFLDCQRLFRSARGVGQHRRQCAARRPAGGAATAAGTGAQ
jgi:hypothetical protein